MTREEAIRRANEVMAAYGFEDRGRDCLERGRFGERFRFAEFVVGSPANERVGDPHWWINYEPVSIEDDGTLKLTHREETSVCVDVATGYAEAWRSL